MDTSEHLPLIPGDIRDGALAELRRLRAYVDALPLDKWSEPSAAAGWTVGDVVAHLNLTFGLYRRLLGSVAEGGGSSNLWRTIGKAAERIAPAASPVLNSVNSALPKLLDRTLAPEVIRGQFDASARQLTQTLERVGPEDYNRPVWYVGGPYPFTFFLALTVNEMALHGWDMESRTAEVADLDAAARRILPWFYWSGTPLMLQLPKDVKGTIQVALSEPGAAMWWRAGGEKVEQGREMTPHPDVSIRGDSATFILTLSGRMTPATALGDALTATGDRTLAERFLASWRLL
ncbi:MAG TPA: maleylpyruvate isomerase N-terminal domain-containing protein [Chloroflexota bacterium]|nr:maleylpyruvate isomerase N-terminal domain-containing protein [Chloroflexota bacterium]